jgi:hypothetical protein
MAAPEANRSAAWQANDKELTLKGTEPPLFNVISGTSMSCPHVSAMVAVVKSHYLSWNPSAIKPAILTTGKDLQKQKLNHLVIFITKSMVYFLAYSISDKQYEGLNSNRIRCHTPSL